MQNKLGNFESWNKDWIEMESLTSGVLIWDFRIFILHRPSNSCQLCNTIIWLNMEHSFLILYICTILEYRIEKMHSQGNLFSSEIDFWMLNGSVFQSLKLSEIQKNVVYDMLMESLTNFNGNILVIRTRVFRSFLPNLTKFKDKFPNDI